MVKRWYTTKLTSGKWSVVDSKNPATFFLFLKSKRLAEDVVKDLNEQNEARTFDYSYRNSSNIR